MIKNGFDPQYPIILVNQGDTLGVINGRHRLLAARSLNIRIWAIVISQEEWTKGLEVINEVDTIVYWYELDKVEQDAVERRKLKTRLTTPMI